MEQIFDIRVTLSIFVLFASMFSQTEPVLAQNVSEYEVKAAFLFKFINFIEWPEVVMGGGYCIGVLGESPIEDHLKRIEGKEINGRKVEVKHFDSPNDLDFCHIIYISPFDVNFKEVAEKLSKAPTLTVSDSKEVIHKGVIVNLVLIGTKVRFYIDNDSAKESGIKISSKLLRLSLKE